MTFPDDRDPALEQLLRSSLTAEADAVTPRGDGLTRIQQRVAARRSRRAWLRPVAAVGAVAVVGGAGVTAYAATHQHSGGDDSLVTSGTPSPSASSPDTTPAPTPTVTTLPASNFPDTAIYPFQTASSVQRSAAYADAVTVATSFVRDFVGEPSVSLVLGKHVGTSVANVTLGRTMADGGSHRDWPVTVVRLVKYDGVWLVVGADDANSMLKVTSPAAGDVVTSPVTVTGPAYGVDEAIQVDVRGLAGSLATTRGHASFGDGSPPWSARVAYDARGALRGAVVATEPSAADGKISRIAVVGVGFGTATDVSYPSYFYGVKNGRVTKFSARNGAALSYLTAPDGVASDPQRVGDSIYYVYAHSTCGNPNVLMSVPASGGSSTTVAVSQQGYAIRGFGLTPDGTRLSLWQVACDGTQTSTQGLLVNRVLASHMSHTIAFPSFPPMVVGDPVWETDGTHVDAVVRTGNQAAPQRFDAFGAKDYSGGAPACGSDPAGGGLPQAMASDSTGQLWIAVENDGGTSLVRCASGSPAVKVFDAPGSTGGPQDVTVTDDGNAALVTDGSGAVWRWSGGSKADRLPTRVPIAQVTW